MTLGWRAGPQSARQRLGQPALLPEVASGVVPAGATPVALRPGGLKQPWRGLFMVGADRVVAERGVDD